MILTRHSKEIFAAAAPTCEDKRPFSRQQKCKEKLLQNKFKKMTKFVIIITVLVSLTELLVSGFRKYSDPREKVKHMDRAASVAAFLKVYEVLMSPRCMNCHPAGDIPLQGDDSHLHTMSPIRG